MFITDWVQLSLGFCLLAPAHCPPQAAVWHRPDSYSYCYSYSQPGGKCKSGTALLLSCSTLALRTPLKVPTNNSFCLPTASLLTNSL